MTTDLERDRDEWRRIARQREEQVETETRRADSAELELREVTGELEKARARLAEATGLLELARTVIDRVMSDDHATRGEVRIVEELDGFVPARSPAQPKTADAIDFDATFGAIPSLAQPPEPTLLERIEAEYSKWHYDEETAPTVLADIGAILRSARGAR